jgi:hypothetical protein
LPARRSGLVEGQQQFVLARGQLELREHAGPPSQDYPLDEVGKAYRQVADRRTPGKIVLTP